MTISLLRKADTIRRLFPKDMQMLKFADFIEELDSWFDVLNSCIKDHGYKPLKSAFEVQLEKQLLALEKFRDTVKNLRVLNIKKTETEGRRIFNEALQPWQHGVIKTSVALVGLYNDLQAKYQIEYICTTKLNQGLTRFSILAEKPY